MSVLQVKKDGVWIDVVGTISDADTLDGKHANAFASIEDVDELRDLLGNTKTPEQFVVTITSNDDGTYSADKTFSEVYTAGYGAIAVWCPNGSDSYVFSVNGYNQEVIFFQSDLFGQSSIFFRFYNDETIHMTEVTYDSDDEPPTNVNSVRDGNTIIVTATYSNGGKSVSTITLNEDSYPISVLKGGVETSLTWEGFE